MQPASTIAEGSGTAACASVKLSSGGLPVAFGAGKSAAAWNVRLVSGWFETNPRKLNVGLDGRDGNVNCSPVDRPILKVLFGELVLCNPKSAPTAVTFDGSVAVRVVY